MLFCPLMRKKEGGLIGQGTFERLDRALGNEAWVQAFSNWMVTRLTRLNRRF
ncbi:hypothetical protein V6Z12_D08G164300 [Gossypium hirsutum]